MRLYLLFLLNLAHLSTLTALNSEGVTLANDYKKNSDLQWNVAMKSLEHFPFNIDDKVLDVGSGDGKITALISDLVS